MSVLFLSKKENLLQDTTSIHMFDLQNTHISSKDKSFNLWANSLTLPLIFESSLSQKST